MKFDHKWEFTLTFHHINSCSILSYLCYLQLISRDILIFYTVLLMLSPTHLQWYSHLLKQIPYTNFCAVMLPSKHVVRSRYRTDTYWHWTNTCCCWADICMFTGLEQVMLLCLNKVDYHFKPCKKISRWKVYILYIRYAPSRILTIYNVGIFEKRVNNVSVT